MADLFRENNPETQATIDALMAGLASEDGVDGGNDFSKRVMQQTQPSLDSILGGSTPPAPDLSFLNNSIVPNMTEQYPNSPMDPMNPPQQKEIPIPPPQTMPTMDTAAKVGQSLDAAQVPQTSSQPMDMSDTDMKQALADRQRNMGMLAILNGANTIGSAIAGVKADPNYTSDLEALAKMPVQNIKEQRQADEEKMALNNKKQLSDPNSETSRLVRSNMKNMLLKMGYKTLADKITDGMSANLIQSTLGGVNMQNLMTHYETEQRKKEDTAARRQIAKDTMAQKIGAQDAKTLERAGTALVAETKRTNTTFGRNASIVAAAQRIETLVGTYPKLDDIPGTQVQEIVKNLDAMLSNSASTVSGQKALMPISVMSEIQMLKSKLVNAPKGAKLGAYLSKIMDTVHRERANAATQIDATQKHILGSYMPAIKRNPNEFAQMLDMMDISPELKDTVMNTHTKAMSPETENNEIFDASTEAGIANFIASHPGMKRTEAIKILRDAGKIK